MPSNSKNICKLSLYSYFSECTTDNSENGQPWCATATYSDGVAIPNNWEDCNRKSKHKLFTWEVGWKLKPKVYTFQYIMLWSIFGKLHVHNHQGLGPP